MSAQPTPTAEDTQPLVLILDDRAQLEEWLASHPPNRLGMPAALNNGVPPRPIWVLGVPSVDQLAELAPAMTAEDTFVKAHELVRDATAEVSQIQNNDEIPVRSKGKAPSKSKKQCRTEVQNAFHDQIILLAAEHPLWNQGRWTIIIKPSQIDTVFAKLAKSLSSGELRKHGSILALRARSLSFDEGTFDSNKSGLKRPKTSRGRRSSGSNKSPGSPLNAPLTPLGIDVFFRPAWNSTAARDVLKIIAGVSGSMASFCKSSLYSLLGIKSGHQLATHTSLYSSKTLASPADAKLWVREHASDNDTMDTSSQVDAAESLRKGHANASLPVTTIAVPDRPETIERSKRELEQETTLDTTVEAEEPAHKKPRNRDSDALERQPSTPPVEATPSPVDEAQAVVDESQDEHMLPVRPTFTRTDPKIAQPSFPVVPEQEPKQPPPAAAAAAAAAAKALDDAPKSTVSSALPKPEEAKDVVEDSQTQTQMEIVSAVGDSTVGRGSSHNDQELTKQEHPSSAHEKAGTPIQKDAAADMVLHAQRDNTEVKPMDQPKAQSADVLQEIPAEDEGAGADVSVLMVSEVKTESTSSFTPAFGDDVEKASPTAKEAQQAKNPNATPISDLTPGLSDLVQEVAAPIVLHQESSDVKSEEKVTGKVKEPLAKVEVHADPSEDHSSTAAANLVDEAPVQHKEAGTSVIIAQEEASAGLALPSIEELKAISAKLEGGAKSAQEVLEPAQYAKATHGDLSAQAYEHEQPADMYAPSLWTSTADQGEADEIGAGHHTTKSDEAQATMVETATTDTVKASPGEADMTFDELIKAGATKLKQFGLEEGAK
ncbi:uncharacterized protein SPSC_00122 [Sporisorium scitamineum]|uniref:Uncharacterized protein n=1 Tax=Sporisorium scitamineum TaxID=49012 RepID=A0A127Z5K9_9BASI|nr:uncharacterized protein SPSC_00122 [Sporisorium scitamineum]